MTMDMNLLGVKQQKNLPWDGKETAFCFALLSPTFNPISFPFVVFFICNEEESEDVRLQCSVSPVKLYQKT
jgi:hypothetical protein